MKILLFVVIATFSTSCLFAQESKEVKKKTFNFGLRHGYSVYNFKSQYDGLSNTNLYVGVFFEKELSDKWAIQLETNYAGFSLLEFPLLFKYKITDKFEIYAGGQLDFSLEQNNTLEEFRSKRLGASFVVGAQYNINSHWYLDSRYVHGFSDQFPIFQGFGNQTIYGKRRAFYLGLGYKF